LIGLRGISDGKAELRHVDDWTEYLHVIDEKLAAAVDMITGEIASGRLSTEGCPANSKIIQPNG
jgi:adenosylhomocysteine nucleosidase